jgi:hypothetical protein
MVVSPLGIAGVANYLKNNLDHGGVEVIPETSKKRPTTSKIPPGRRARPAPRPGASDGGRGRLAAVGRRRAPADEIVSA